MNGKSLRFKKMKFKFMLIGVALALMLCISPVAAVSGSEFKIVIDDSGDIPTYTYKNRAYPNEKYIHIHTSGTNWFCSLVTFKPANIPDAPVMVVDTSYCEKEILLTNSVDKWEIKYYSSFWYKPTEPDPEYLKYAGVFNLNELFGEYISKGSWLELQLSRGQYIWCPDAIPYGPEIDIPDVD
jgi:hypothetical protein